MPNEKKPLPRITLANLRPPYPDFDYFAHTAENPFRHDSKQFELVNAWWLCESATLAYSDPDFVRQTFQGKTVLQDVRDFSTVGGTQSQPVAVASRYARTSPTLAVSRSGPRAVRNTSVVRSSASGRLPTLANIRRYTRSTLSR